MLAIRKHKCLFPLTAYKSCIPSSHSTKVSDIQPWGQNQPIQICSVACKQGRGGWSQWQQKQQKDLHQVGLLESIPLSFSFLFLFLSLGPDCTHAADSPFPSLSLTAYRTQVRSLRIFRRKEDCNPSAVWSRAFIHMGAP